MRKLQWMAMALLVTWGAGLAAGLLMAAPMGGPGGGPAGLGPGGGGSGMGGGGLMAALGLSQAQKTQLKALRRARRDKLQIARNDLQDARGDLRDLMASGNASDDQLRAQHAQVEKLQAALEEQRFQSILEVRDILTPAQRKKMRELMQQNQRRREFQRGRQGQGGQGGPQGPGQGGAQADPG